MEQRTGQATAVYLRGLMTQARVNILQACTRSGVTPSTFYRWQGGSTPSGGTVDKMKRAILEIAEENSTLPAKLVTELNDLRASVKKPQASQKRDLAARVDRLEKVVTEQLGAAL